MKTIGALEISAKFAQKKNNFLIPIVDKYTAVFLFLWGEFGAKARRQYSKLDGNNYSTHFRLEIAFLQEFRPKKE